MQDALLEAGNGVAVSDVLEGRDEGQLSELLLTRALQGRSDVIGIYDAGAANLAVSAQSSVHLSCARSSSAMN